MVRWKAPWRPARGRWLTCRNSAGQAFFILPDGGRFRALNGPITGDYDPKLLAHSLVCSGILPRKWAGDPSGLFGRFFSATQRHFDQVSKLQAPIIRRNRWSRKELLWQPGGRRGRGSSDERVIILLLSDDSSGLSAVIRTAPHPGCGLGLALPGPERTHPADVRSPAESPLSCLSRTR
jgi:hypothetical protein